jgi:hypothetical protein
MHFITSHPVVSAITACYILSTLVDALKQVAPRDGDSRLYVFVYAVIDGLAGNAVTALKAFLSKKA